MAIHPILRKQYSSWNELETLIAKIESTAEKGDVFEQFAYFYFLFNARVYQIAEIYSPKVPGRDIPRALVEKLKLSKKDDGVDGVIVRTDGKVVGYQCKFRSGRVSPPSNELNNFWAEAEFADYRLVFSNAVKLPSDFTKRRNALRILIDQLHLCGSDFFLFLNNTLGGAAPTQARQIAKPWSFQKDIVASTLKGLSQVSRGKLIAACASGKTLMTLWIAGGLGSRKTLFLVPNLELVRQSVDRWVNNAEVAFKFIAVCSDKTMSLDSSDSDEIENDPLDTDIPVTTNPGELSKFLTQNSNETSVVFSTYHSTQVVADAAKTSNYEFDLIIFDEAHRTAGTKDSGLFGKALLDEYIRSKKRLFITATERVVKPWIKDKFEQNDRTLFSMDDESSYGPVLYKLPFGAAIKQKIICDYKIVLCGGYPSESASIFSENRYLTVAVGVEEQVFTAQQLLTAHLFLKSAKELGVKKIISYHSTIAEAKAFSNLLNRLDSKFVKAIYGVSLEKGAFLHVNGSMSAAERAEVFRYFESAEFGLISNVRCLTEGIDIPYVDGILFAEPKNSVIDIVQAVGRALRKPAGSVDKTAHIIIPTVMNEDGSFDDHRFETFHTVIQAMRDQDDTLAEWIDHINLGVVKGQGRRFMTTAPKFQLILPTKIDLERFTENLALRIAEVNSRPAGQAGLGAKLGKNQRGSELKRLFKSIGDYNALPFKESLVDPTLAKFKSETESKDRSDLIVNNNNVSHSERLGLIKQVSKNKFTLTGVGKLYWKSEIEFFELFKNQILLFWNDDDSQRLYPYRSSFEVLKSVGSMNYIEFLFSLYSMRPGNKKVEVDKCISIVSHIKTKYPNVMVASDAIKENLQNELNQLRGSSFSDRDVWTDRTTTFNQFRFLTNHLSLFTNLFVYDQKNRRISLIEGRAGLIETALAESAGALSSLADVDASSLWVKSWGKKC